MVRRGRRSKKTSDDSDEDEWEAPNPNVSGRGSARARVDSDEELEIPPVRKRRGEAMAGEPNPRMPVADDVARERFRAQNLAAARNRASFYAHYHGGEDDGFSRTQDHGMPPADQSFSYNPRTMWDNLPKVVTWVPSASPNDVVQVQEQRPASLYSKCIDVLCDNIDYADTFEGVPDDIKLSILTGLQRLGQINSKVAQLILSAGPVRQICIPDCSKIPDNDFIEILRQCSSETVQTLDLRFCGRPVTDKCLLEFKYPNLKKLFFHGLYRVTDVGFRTFIDAATGLTEVELRQCHGITELSIESIANYVGRQLEVLVLEGCSSLRGKQILLSLKRLPKLKVLSLACVQDVDDAVAIEVVEAIGENLEELDLSGCSVTDSTMIKVGACCSGLKKLGAGGLKLSDVSIRCLAEGCKSLSNVIFDNCEFSDEGLADFFSACGASLRNVSLRSIKLAGDNALLALATHAKATLETLNASFCRNMTEDGFGFLADSCKNLVELNIYGCSQVTPRLYCHSNKALKIVK